MVTFPALRHKKELRKLCACSCLQCINYMTFFLTRSRNWLRHCATSRKVPPYIADGVSAIFFDIMMPAVLWTGIRLSH